MDGGGKVDPSPDGVCLVRKGAGLAGSAPHRRPHSLSPLQFSTCLLLCLSITPLGTIPTEPWPVPLCGRVSAKPSVGPSRTVLRAQSCCLAFDEGRRGYRCLLGWPPSSLRW